MVDTEITSESDDDDAVAVVGARNRLWLVQCKRERAIGPKKLLQYLDEIKPLESEKLHGIVFAAACDFSKIARDQFRDRCAQLGIAEWHLWGKAEIEDRLFRPENDALLFAYFGISLTIRRRSQRADLRARLAMKRKADRFLGQMENHAILLRSPDAVKYAYRDEIPGFDKLPPWGVRKYTGMAHDGLKFLLHRHFAWLDDDGKNWDAMLCCNDATNLRDDPWARNESPDISRDEAWRVWEELPDKNRAWLETVAVVPFDTILDIDDIGDEYFREPHVYVPFVGEKGPFSYCYHQIETISTFERRHIWLPDFETDRIEKFPVRFRERQQAPE